MAWKTSSKIQGLQSDVNKYGEKIYRLKQKKGSVFLIDYFGTMPEEEVIKVVAVLKANRKNNFGAQTFKELKEQVLEQRREKYEEEQEQKQAKREAKRLAEANILAKYYYNIFFPDMLRSSNRSEETNRNEYNSFNKWCMPLLGEIPLSQLKKEHIQCFIDNMLDAKNSPRNIQYVYGMLKQMYEHAEEYFHDTPTPLKRWMGKTNMFPRVDNEKQCYLEFEEAKRLLHLLYHWQDYCRANKIRIRQEDKKDAYGLAVISLFTGLRFGNVARIKWGDIKDGVLYSRTTKNKKDKYTSMSNPLVQQMLQERWTPEVKPEDYIFTNENGGIHQRPPRYYYRAVEILKFNEEPHRIGKKEQRIDFHALRHTNGTWLVEIEASPFEIKDSLGHSSLKSTERYTKIMAAKKNRHVQALADAFNSNTAMPPLAIEE